MQRSGIEEAAAAGNISSLLKFDEISSREAPLVVLCAEIFRNQRALSSFCCVLLRFLCVFTHSGRTYPVAAIADPRINPAIRTRLLTAMVSVNMKSALALPRTLN